VDAAIVISLQQPLDDGRSIGRYDGRSVWRNDIRKSLDARAPHC
jgi:hypothetical protein